MLGLIRKWQSWRNRLWLTSTIAEINWHTGRVVRVPGQWPRRERWALYRLWRRLTLTWRA